MSPCGPTVLTITIGGSTCTGLEHKLQKVQIRFVGGTKSDLSRIRHIWKETYEDIYQLARVAARVSYLRANLKITGDQTNSKTIICTVDSGLPTLLIH